MAKPGYKDLGISSKEYEEALLLERLFKLVKKNPCSTCLLKKPTHVDLDRFDLLCTTCSKRCSSKLQIGKGLISMTDLERLESKYDKSKKKESLKHKKHSHKHRSSSVSTSDSYENYKRREKHRSPNSDSSNRRRSKSKHLKRKDSSNYPSDYYPETYDYPVSHQPAPKPYSRLHTEDRYTSRPKGHKEKSKDKSKSRHRSSHRDSLNTRDGYMPRELETIREHDRTDGYPPMANYPYYPQSNYQDPYYENYPNYKYGQMKRYSTTHDFPSYARRDVPGMMGLLASHPRGRDMVFRSQYALPPPEDKGFSSRKDHRAQTTALTNGFQAFKSLPPFNREENLSNNPFSKRSYGPPTQAYDFSTMRDALNPPRTHNRYSETYRPPHDFNTNKLGNPGFPESGGNFLNRF